MRNKMLENVFDGVWKSLRGICNGIEAREKNLSNLYITYLYCRYADAVEKMSWKKDKEMLDKYLATITLKESVMWGNSHYEDMVVTLGGEP